MSIENQVPDDEVHSRYVIATASLAFYRLQTMRLLCSNMGASLSIYAGDRSPNADIRLIAINDLDYCQVKNQYFGPGLLYQNLPWSSLLRCETVVLDLNPRVLHVWAILVLRRMLGRRSLLWGHAWPRSGKASRSDRLRGVLRRLSNGFISYTRTQADELRLMYPGKACFAAPNALYRQVEMRPASKFSANGRRRFIYVGRLSPEKKPILMVEAFASVVSEMRDVDLVIAGEGTEYGAIEAQIVKLGLEDRIQLVGHVSEYEKIRDLYDGAICALSPGYVGLSITQSLSFGVPMIIADNEPHAPEVEAVVLGFNAAYFPSDDATSLAQLMRKCANGDGVRFASFQQISDHCSSSYSVEAMELGLRNAIIGLRT